MVLGQAQTTETTGGQPYTRTPQELGSARVNTISWCSCQDSRFDSSHLAICHNIVELKKGNGVAISYGIGDWERKRRVVGHLKDNQDTPYSLVLGSEWQSALFLDALVQLTREKSSVWLDQFSIDQESDDIGVELQRVPLIYATFETVSLLPYGPCPCFVEAVDLFEKGLGHITKYGDLDDFDLAGSCTKCINTFPLCAYFSRLWTRQEFCYASEISVRYCTRLESQCLVRGPPWPLPAGLEQVLPSMNDCMRHVYQDRKTQNPQRYFYPEAYATKYLCDLRHHLVNNLILMVCEFWRRGRKEGRQHSYWAAKFLLGTTLTRERYDRDTNFQMEVIQHANLEASLKKDYILASFPANHGYVIPKAWDTMDIASLFEDALEQTQQHNGIQFRLSFLPAGLFNLRCSSTVCKPTLFMDPSTANSISDFFGMFAGSGAAASVSRTGHLTFRTFNWEQPPDPRIVNVRSYEHAFGASNTEDVLQWLGTSVLPSEPAFNRTHTVLANIHTRHLCTGILQGIYHKPVNSTTDLEFLAEMFIQVMRAKARGEPVTWGQQDLPEVDHYNIVYDTVARCFGIKPHMARAKGLGLVVSFQTPPCIGFTNGVIYRELRKLEKGEERDKSAFDFDRWVSINVGLNGLHGGTYMLVYDAYHVKGDILDPASVEQQPKDRPVRIYHVGVVWLRHDLTKCQDPAVNAELVQTWEDCDSVLY